MPQPRRRNRGDFQTQFRTAVARAPQEAARAPPIASVGAGTPKVTIASWLHGLLDHDEFIRFHSPQNLMDARRPLDLHVGSLRGTKAKVQALVIRRKVASCCCCEADLAVHLNAGTEAVTIAAHPTQRYCQPMQFPAAIQIQLGVFAKRGSDHGHPAIVVQIAERSAASSYRYVRTGVGLFEMTVMIQGKQRRLPIAQRAVIQLHVIEDMALHNEGVLPAVIVKVLQPDAPARRFPGKRSEASFQFLRAESSLAVVMKNDVGLVGKLSDQNIGKAIVVVVLKD